MLVEYLEILLDMDIWDKIWAKGVSYMVKTPLNLTLFFALQISLTIPLKEPNWIKVECLDAWAYIISQHSSKKIIKGMLVRFSIQNQSCWAYVQSKKRWLRDSSLFIQRLQI